MNDISVADVLAFWFDETAVGQRFEKDVAFDAMVAARFGDALAAARQGELWRWRERRDGRLAEIIVLDQFSRNIWRDHPLAFGCDPLALALAQHAVTKSDYRVLPPERLAFLLMPYMHSESPLIHEQAMLLFAMPGLERELEFEIRHKAIIDRFGRFPHRNEVLGRVSTAEEVAFLEQPGSRF